VDLLDAAQFWTLPNRGFFFASGHYCFMHKKHDTIKVDTGLPSQDQGFIQINQRTQVTVTDKPTSPSKTDN
jgi:hypothetical protein